MDRSNELGTESIGKLLVKFSIPAIVGMLVNALYNVVDTFFVGNGVGPLALTATSLVFPIMLVMMAFGMLVGIGSTALVSIKLGENKKDSAENILGNALSLIIILSVVLTALGLLFLDPVLIYLKAKGEVLIYAKQFITIILYGTIFQSIGFGLNNLIRADGNPKMAMFTMIIGAAINIILNPIFIFVLHFGIRGSAIATVISQFVSAVWVISYFLSKKSSLKLKKKYIGLKKHIVVQIFSIGISPFSMQIAASIVTIILNNSLQKYGGDLAVASIGIINKVSMLILMPLFGINQGSQPIIGYNFGAKKYERVKTALKLSIKGATVISVTGFILVEVFANHIIKAFCKGDLELSAIGSHGIRIFLFMLPIIGFQIVSSNYFQAVGKAKISIFLGLSRQVIILIPLLLILPPIFKLNGVWLAAPVSDLIASLLTGTFLVKELRNLNILEQSVN